MTYTAPIEDMGFVLGRLIGWDRLAPDDPALGPDLVRDILAEAGRLAANVLAPLNAPGDRSGAVLDKGVVRAAAGFADAYRQFRDGGWNALPFAPAHGGQGLPWALGFAVQEMWQAANMAFGLCPLLNQAAIELLAAHGSPAQQALYLPRLVSGEWTGTMEMTEPQAGSDVGALATRAVPGPDGQGWRLHGQKIFITWGEHDLAPNIIHMVLARTPGAPPGSRGISLFLVPKFLVDGEGRPGERNDLRCVALEHKLGIRASPTCVMAYGDGPGAQGFLIGQEHQGLAAMFTMMNNARLAIGLQGIAIAERAYQQARDYARLRIQGRPAEGGPPVPIIRHPDVRRMLLSMRARTEAARALAYLAGHLLDRSRRHPETAERVRAQVRLDLLTPVVKAWSTDHGVAAASTGIQVHGGTGFIEETGAAQHLRDARIAPIYEGTNGIQANDLVFRKLGHDEGTALASLLAEIRADLADMPTGCAGPLAQAVERAEAAASWLLAALKRDPRKAAAGAVPFLRLLGTLCGGWLMGRSAALARTEAPGFAAAKTATAGYYAAHILPHAGGLAHAVMEGTGPILAFPEEAF